MFNLPNEKLYLIVGLLALVGLAIYLINYQIKSTVRYELTMIKKHKLKKMHLLKMKRDKQKRRNIKHQHDMDSYIDPIDNEQYEEEQEEPQRAARFSQNDLLQRDLIDA